MTTIMTGILIINLWPVLPLLEKPIWPMPRTLRSPKVTDAEVRAVHVPLRSGSSTCYQQP